MVTQTGNRIDFDINSRDVEMSIAWLTDLRDYSRKQDRETGGNPELTAALTTAIEVMQAFWCEKFGGAEG